MSGVIQILLAAGSENSVSSSMYFTLQQINGNDDSVVGIITDGVSISAIAGTGFNINAIPTESIGSVVFSMTGPVNKTQTESVAPYALYGDTAGNFSSGAAIPVGTYNLTVTAWSASGGTGTILGQDIIVFYAV